MHYNEFVYEMHVKEKNKLINKQKVNIMKEFFKSTIGKCFSYTLLCIFIFAAMTLIGCFVAGNTNVFEWYSSMRFLIIASSVAATGFVIIKK
jgi:hypothetical protein